MATILIILLKVKFTVGFLGFGLDGTNTAGIFNDSGGAVTIISFGGTVPTVKNGTNATTNAQKFVNLTLTGLKANSEIRIYEAGTTTEIDGVENSGTTFATTTSASSVDIVVHALGYEYQRLNAVDTTENLTLPISQRVDRNYSNP